MSVSVLNRQAANHRLPAWARVWAWCLAHADQHGHARAYPGQLRQELGDLTATDVSRAIAQARSRRVIDRCSNAGCLVLPGHRDKPCSAIHRGDT